MDHFFRRDLGYEGMPIENLTEAIRYARLSCLKQLLNDVISI